MILKIRNQGAWWLHDDLARVHFGNAGEGRVRRNVSTAALEVRTGQQIGGGGADAYAELTPDGVFFEPDGTERRTATMVTEWEYPAWVCYRDRQDHECFVVFDEAFLLNDNGQTIERIR